MQVKLESRDGGHVGTYEIPPFKEDPQVIGWGERVFKKHRDFVDHVVYRECFAYAIPPGAPHIPGYAGDAQKAAGDAQVQREMPRYKCHKEVWALRIESVRPIYGEAGHWIVPADEGYGQFAVDEEYVAKHNPQPGGYYVVYADGYKSYSPARAFEEGYTRV